MDIRVGIVGSRRRNSLRDRKIVFDLVEYSMFKNPKGKIIIVSGHCPEGADAYAEEAAKVFSLPTIIHPVPTDPPIKDKHDFRERAYARNRLIALDSDIIYALVAADRTGGTENTIEHGIELQKKVFMVDETGTAYLE